MTLCLEKSETVEISPLGEVAPSKDVIRHDTFFYGLDLKNDRLFHVSSTSSDVVGYKNDHIIQHGLSWFVQQIHPEDLKQLDILSDNQENVEIFPHIKYRFKHKNGGYFPIYEHRCLLYDDNGHPSFLIGRIEKI